MGSERWNAVKGEISALAEEERDGLRCIWQIDRDLPNKQH